MKSFDSYETAELRFSQPVHTPDELTERRERRDRENKQRIRKLALRVGAAVGIAAGVGFGVARSIEPDFACYTKDAQNPTFYSAGTAYEAAQQVPGVWQNDLNPNDIPMQLTPESEAMPATAFEHSVSTGLYGPTNCSPVK
jgi:hypothetical protein